MLFCIIFNVCVSLSCLGVSFCVFLFTLFSLKILPLILINVSSLSHLFKFICDVLLRFHIFVILLWCLSNKFNFAMQDTACSMNFFFM